MQFPLDLRFKIIALANQIYVHDATGNPVFYVKQKMFKLKEKVEIYRDDSKTELLYNLQADRVIDLSPLFKLTDANDREVGSIKRNGGRSIWRADYNIEIGGQPFAHVKEANVWAKVGDGLLGELPIIGMLAGYVFHPRYIISDVNQQQIAEIKKLPAFFEGKYQINSDKLNQADEQTKSTFSALLMTVALLERSRG